MIKDEHFYLLDRYLDSVFSFSEVHGFCFVFVKVAHNGSFVSFDSSQ